VADRLLQIDALFWLFHQQLGNEVNAAATVVLPLGRVELHLVLARHPYCLFLAIVVKG